MAHHEHHHGGHGHGHGENHGHGHDEAGHADMLDLDAEVLGPFLDDLTGWAAGHAPDEVRTVADLGAGTGTGTLALARRFAEADLIAIDRSESMLDRVRAAVQMQGLDGRVRVVPADLDIGWPAVGPVDLAWAALSLHEVADPDRVLGDVHGALNPGGVLVVVEMDGFPRFLPDDIGFGRPGLESRCHGLLADAGWNTHPDWRAHLERAGFEVAAQRTFAVQRPAAPTTGRYARSFLGRARDFLADRLADDDLAALDRLLADGPDSVDRRGDLTVRTNRTAWAASPPVRERGRSDHHTRAQARSA